MDLTNLQLIWFVLVFVLILGFAVLAGFDFGVGNLHLFLRPEEREVSFRAIGPFWDSNQVWLLTGGGALFAAFPMVYATVFSAFYLALMLVLLALILRAVAIEFHGQLQSPSWRKTWDLSFGVGSILASTLFGVAVGNLLRGLPLDATYNFTGTFFSLLNPYSLVIGLLALALFTTHGAAFMVARTEESISTKVRIWAKRAGVACITLFAVASVWTYLVHPGLMHNFVRLPILLVLPGLVLVGLSYYPVALKTGARWSAFVASVVTTIGLVGTWAASVFPNFVFSSPVANSLTLYNASSSKLTLMVMLVIAGVGVPIVIAYTAYVYRKFKGTVG